MDNYKLIDTYFDTIVNDDKIIKLLFETDKYSIGKQKDSICFVVKSEGGKTRKFKNGDMSISMNSPYIISDKEGLYSIIFYNTVDKKRIEIFIDVLMNYANRNTLNSDQLLELYNEISEVFKKIEFDYNKFIGNLGELLFIKHIYDIHNVNMVNYYEASDSHLVDFKYDNINFEIKTTISGERKHLINNDQLIGNGYICSITVFEENTGMSFDEIYNSIKKIFENSYRKKSYFENYLLSIPINYSNMKFSINIDNIRFYSFRDIPKFVNFNDAISDIRYTCNLSNLPFERSHKIF